MTNSLQEFSNRLYAPLGRFIVNFENVCDAMRITCISIFNRHGLQKSELAELTFAGLTASPLLDIYISLISEAFTFNKKQMVELNRIKERTQKLITIRNKTIHSTWVLFDFADIENGIPEGLLVSNRRKKQGLERHIISLSKDQLDIINKETTEVVSEIRAFNQKLL